MTRKSGPSLRLSLALLLLALACTCARGEQGEVSEPVPCSAAVSGRAEDLLSYKIGSLDGTLSVRDLVDRLHRPGHLPISFVESARPANVRFAGEALTARDALLRATDTGAYLCQVIRGHVVVYPSEPLYQREICGVRIRDAYRARAMRKYLERLAEETEELKHVGWLSNGDPASLTYSTQVSLSRCAPLITHFAEILGKDHEVFFSIRQWKPGMLIATFGEVWANPRPE